MLKAGAVAASSAFFSGGFMIFLPTRYRPDSLRRFIHEYQATAVLEDKVLVIINEDDASYDEMDLPSNFSIFRSPEGMRISQCLNRAFKEYPNEKYYAVIADDVSFETHGWDTILLRECIAHGISYADDGYQGEGLPTHPFIRGDIPRRLGWLAYPHTKHCFVDNVWKIIGNIVGLKYCGDVKLTHLHPVANKGDDDVTYKNQPSYDDDRKAYLDLIASGMPELKEKLKPKSGDEHAEYTEQLAGKPLREVMLCVPTQHKTVDVDFAQSLLREFIFAASKGILITPLFYIGSSLPPAARNYLLAEFYASGAEAMIFIDSDEGWQPGAITHVVNLSQDIIVGAVRGKTDEEKYAVRWLPDNPEKPGLWANEDGLIEIEAAGTGFMKISRHAAEKIINSYPEREYIENTRLGVAWNVFPLEVHERRLWGEDMGFCRLARECGLKIYLDPEINFSHTGIKVYSGSIGKWLKNRKEEEIV